MMDLSGTLVVADEAEMMALGEFLAKQLRPKDVVYLRGDLGVGKTTLARAIIHASGFEGRVKSPSYGLIEQYPLPSGQIAHLDLYRLGQPEEISDLGVETYLGDDCIMLIEWPEKATGRIPAPTWEVMIEDALSKDVGSNDARTVEVTRY